MTRVRDLEAVKGTSTLLKVDPMQLKIKDDFNCRIDYGDTPMFRKSIRNNGVRKPLKVCRIGEELFVKDGHRRITSVWKELEEFGSNPKLATVPCIVEAAPLDSAEALLDQFIENDGKPFTPIEEARLFSRLKNDMGFTVSKISDQLGKSIAYVADRLILLDADPELLDMMQDGEVGSTLIVNAVKCSQNGGNPDAQAKVKSLLKAGDKEAAKKAATTSKDGIAYISKKNKALLDGYYADYSENTAQAIAGQSSGADLALGKLLGASEVLKLSLEDLVGLGYDLPELS